METYRTDPVDGWSAVIDVDELGGAPVVVGVRIEPAGDLPPGGLSSNAVRALNLGAAFQAARSNFPSWQSARATERLESRLSEVLDDPPKSESGRGYSDLYYAAWAAAFRLFVAKGDPAPLQRLADAWADGKYDTAARRLKEARKRGLIDSPTKGQVGGQLTPAAIELLGVDAA